MMPHDGDVERPMTEKREYQLGDRVRTSFDGAEFPGVYEIVGFNNFRGGGALLESDDGDKTWSPIAELHLVTDPQPALTYRQTNAVNAFAEFIGKLKPEAAEAALTLLKSMICVACGTPLTEKRPRCYCECDE